MNFFLLEILFYLGVGTECPERPNDYLDLPSKPQPGNKYYSCSKEYGYDSQIGLTNSILSIYYCSFKNIVAILGKESLGIIKIKIDESMSSSIIGNINIEYCSFEFCYGAILIDSTDSTRRFNIYNCTFTKCQAMQGPATIDFKSVNGIITKCYFKDCLTTDSRSGYISFNPPKIENNDQIFTITDNTFDHSGQNSYSFLSIVNDNCKLNFSNNKAIIPELIEEIYVISYPKDADINGWIFKENCIEPFRPDAITSTNNMKIVDSFSECKKEGIVCPPIQIPDSRKYESHCYEERNDKVNDIVSKNKLISFFSCSFTSVRANDDNKGGAVFIKLDYEFDSIYLPFFVYNCSFIQCTAFEGGAIYIDSILSYVSRTFEISFCKFVSNKCVGNDNTFGGAIFINSKMNDFEIFDCEFDSNEACFGGAIYYTTSLSSSSSSHLARVILSDDDDFALKLSDCKFVKNKASKKGAAICLMIKNEGVENAIGIINCEFNENKIDDEMPENGGAVYLEFDSSSNKYKKNSFQISDCIFIRNAARSKGGAICISILKGEQMKSIEINRCSFKQNQAGTENSEGYGSDICYTYDSQSDNLHLLKIDSNSALRINKCNFSESVSKFRGGSIYLSILNKKTLKSVEIKECLFKEINSYLGGAVDIQSSNPSVLFHIFNCDFEGESSIFFNGITGHVENCRFNDIKNVIPIHYDCYSSELTNEENSFSVEKCSFYQQNEIYSLIFIVPKISSRFSFVNNAINIPNNKTFVFNCDGDNKLEGSWSFNGNTINPDNENIINSENATKIHFYASCLKGFSCTSHRLPGYECEKNKHCSVNGDEQSSVSFIDVSGSTFNGLKDEEEKGGAAIYVLNYGALISDSKFIECTAEKKGGGAIYIHINKIIDSLVSITDSSFSKCSAVFGGAVFVYSDKVENFVLINNCKFEQNKAKGKEESNENQFFDGSAILLNIKNGQVDNCDFKNNNRNSIKISNKFDNSIKSINELSESTKELNNLISINSCSFNAGENSSSSIFYLNCDKNKVLVDVKNCIFKGKIKKESFHIDGFSVFEKEKISSFNLKSCKFNDAINNSINYEVLSFDQNSNIHRNKFNLKISNNLVILYICGLTASFTISVIFFLIMKIKTP